MAPQACCGADSSQNPPLQPYSDISGTGVIVSFIGSACLVLVLLIGNYLACFDPTANPFALDPDSSDAACSPGAPAPDPMSSDNSANWWRPNRVDCWFLGRVRRKRGPWRNAKKAFVECIMDMSDVQLLTGLAVLVSGFFSLQCGSPNGPPISAYHWQMVVNLAWFSIIVHLASLSVLHTHLRRSPRMRLLRFTLSLLLLVLLLVAIGPTAFFNWRGPWINSKIGAAGFVYDPNTSFSVSAANMSSSAICYFDFSYGFSKFNQISSELSIKFSETLAAQEVILSMTLLVSVFATRTVKLFKPLSSAFNSSLRRFASKALRSVFTTLLRSTFPSKSTPIRLQLWRSLFLWPCVAVFYWARILADALTSQLFEVVAILFSLLWGTLKLFDLRGYSPALYEEESKFTFGQVLPVLLLVGSAFSASNSFLSRLLNKSPTSDSTRQPSPASGDDTMIPTSDTAEQVGLAATEKEWDLNTAISNDCYASNSWFGPCVVFLILQFTITLYAPLTIRVVRSQAHNSNIGYEGPLSNRPNQLRLGLQILPALFELLAPLLVAISLDQKLNAHAKRVGLC
ncbi:hypothetical protein GGTG_03550 [Gaeumannomyces tritici R3-111a-1]|uniref:Uncharacterized protein n=1 Tax=Gaeumannomyces tritici (strain R3-111a-1) TaxID=644352 RepID=J3NQJ4_GAET3|nr:hypothetical protein GGTG_03550 [Gaeumannomyces tritici R3-111a-1]EJT78450.1 hypothetical protein GGTG_03550 [Gaeumannomyces tritici R3-111a-1]